MARIVKLNLVIDIISLSVKSPVYTNFRNLALNLRLKLAQPSSAHLNKLLNIPGGIRVWKMLIRQVLTSLVVRPTEDFFLCSFSFLRLFFLSVFASLSFFFFPSLSLSLPPSLPSSPSPPFSLFLSILPLTFLFFFFLHGSWPALTWQIFINWARRSKILF